MMVPCPATAVGFGRFLPVNGKNFRLLVPVAAPEQSGSVAG